MKVLRYFAGIATCGAMDLEDIDYGIYRVDLFCHSASGIVFLVYFFEDCTPYKTLARKGVFPVKGLK